MRVTVVYYSLHGNTKQVALAVAETLGEAGEVNTVSVGELTASDLHGADLVVMGAPTHKMNAPEVVRTMLDRLPRGILDATEYAAFDTSYEMSRWLQLFTAARQLDKRMRKLGGKRTAAPETFLVERDHEGPLQAGEVDRARQWAGALAARITA